VGWTPASDLGWGRRPKLHGMQEVRLHLDRSAYQLSAVRVVLHRPRTGEPRGSRGPQETTNAEVSDRFAAFHLEHGNVWGTLSRDRGHSNTGSDSGAPRPRAAGAAGATASASISQLHGFCCFIRYYPVGGM
jgi:hypothetical protein